MTFPIVQTCPMYPGLARACENHIYQRIISDNGYSDKKVFINIPYLQPYIPFAVSIWTILVCCDLEPVFANDLRLSSRARVCKICELIQTCKYAISDISENDDIDNRRNIAFEIGMVTALGRHGIILIENEHKYDERLSDYKIFEPLSYEFNINILISKLLEWIDHDIEEIKIVPEPTQVKSVIDEVNKMLNIGPPKESLTMVVRSLQKGMKGAAQYHLREVWTPSAGDTTHRPVRRETEI